MVNTHLPSLKEYKTLPKSKKIEIAEEVFDALFKESLEDEHGFEYMDIHFLQKNTSKVEKLSDQQKLKVADDEDVIEQAKEYFLSQEDKLAALLGIKPSKLEELSDEDASEDMILKIVNYFIKIGDYYPIKYDLIRVLTEEKEMDKAYKLYALDYVFNTWGDERITGVWEKVRQERKEALS